MTAQINVIGAGLAGCEAAWQISQMGLNVNLFEMKPNSFSPAHQKSTFSELVCSNSLGSNVFETAPGLLKSEMREVGSLIIECADKTKVPAGGALAVDRDEFSQVITEKIKKCEKINVINKKVTDIPEGNDITVIATGPLTEGDLLNAINKIIGYDLLHFFDASAPIVTKESIDMAHAFIADRYGRGTSDYINCPLDKKQYENFRDELLNAEPARVKDFEKSMIFEGCMPIEVLAKRGIDAMRFGPLKPVGLIDPSTEKEPYAIVQLRQDNSRGTFYNLVGFQTRLKWPEQKRVFSLIPALSKAEFLRYGVMHRNTFINSPQVLKSTYEVKTYPGLFFAGQISGVEGYVESASSGMVAGINAALRVLGKDELVFPDDTAIGALCRYISDESVLDFQPMKINFGIINHEYLKIRNKKERRAEIAKRALEKTRTVCKKLKFEEK